MGQTLGRAPLLPVSRQFANLPCRCIHELWKAFNDVAEGFGLTREEMIEILRVALREFLGYTEKKLENLSRELFSILDDDKNDLADALEFLSCLCIISGMSAREKMVFVFGMYDFDESGVLTVDEMILLLRSTLSGLCKLSEMDSPSEQEAERVAIGAFENAKSIDGSTISVEDFVRYCTNTPEIMSWLDFYLEIAEAKRVPIDQAGDPTSADCLILAENNAICPQRTAAHRIAMDDELGQCEEISQGIESNIYTRQDTQEQDKKKDSTLQPWRHMVALAPPEKFINDNIDVNAGRPPTQGLELEWIHGLNAQRRNILAYSALGELVYPAGTLGIVLDTANRKQRFVTAHTDIVECLRTYNKGAETIVATGQAGHVPKIVVWACTTSEILSTIRGLHRSAVLYLDFSGCGSRLVTVGAPVSNCVDATASQLVAIYAWEKPQLLFTAALDVTLGGLVLDSRFLGSGHPLDFAVCGQRQLYFFWNEDTQKNQVRYRQEAGLFCNRVCAQPLLCVVGLEIVKIDTNTTNRKIRNVIVTGTASGHLLEWESRTCIQARKVHALAVTALATHSASSDFGLVSGSNDGRIQLWTKAMELGPSLDLKSIGAAMPGGIRGLAWDAARRKIAVITESAELYELILNKDGRTLRSVEDGPLITGHAERRLCALAVHPCDPTIYATVGEDCCVNLWNAEKKRTLRSTKLDTMGRCCAFSSDGAFLCVGLGGVDKLTGERERKDGAFCVLDTETLCMVHEARDSKQPISCIAFSPDGITLACGSEDRILYLYNAKDFASTAKCRGHRGRLMQLDWSYDSKFLQSTDDVGELLYWDADSGEQRPPRFVKDIQWHTSTCVFGWHLQGAWGSESVLSSPHLDELQLVSASRDDELLATMDNFGKIRLWAYPANSSTAVSRSYRAHAAPGGNIRFANDGARLISTGRGDGVIAQWHIVLPEEDENATNSSSRSKGGEKILQSPSSVASTSESIKSIVLHNAGSKLDRSSQLEASIELEKTALFLLEERGDDEDYAPTRPWQRSLVAPSRPPNECLAVPADRLELEWVHGVRSHDIRGQLSYCQASGDLLFPAGNVVVSMNSRERNQRFMNEHAGEVVSVCVHETLPIAASGDLCALPTVVVWDYVTLQPQRVFKGYHKRAVFLLAFSPDEEAKFLVTIGSDDANTAVIFDWRHDWVVARTSTQKSKPLDLLFSRPGRGFGAGECGFILCGDGFVHYWNFNGSNGGASANATTQSVRLGIGKHRKAQPFLCLAWLEQNNLVVGALDGALFRFSGRHLDKVFPRAHAGSINAATSSGEGLATCGSDGFVRLWNSSNLEPRLEIDLRNLGALDACAQAVTWDEKRSRVAVATMSSEIWEFDASDGSNVGGGNGAVLHGHYGGELWGLSVHPTLPQFATCGDDAMLRIWSIFEKRQVRFHTLEMSARACAYSPDGLRLAIGYGAAKSNISLKEASSGATKKQFEGKLAILDLDDFSVLHETRDSHKWITEIKYSPSGELLAVGSADTRIYMYVFDNSMLRLQHMITQHSSAITHLDFSVTNAKMQFLQSNCAGHELCFFEADTGMYIPAASRLKDVKWTSNTCPLSWAAQGTWPAENDGTEVTACDASLKSHAPTLAAADNFGRIRLYRFPVSSSSAKFKENRVHSQHVTKLRWAGGDSHLLSCSAHDKCVLQWRHVVDDAAVEEEDAFIKIGTGSSNLHGFTEEDMGTLSRDVTYAPGQKIEDELEDDAEDDEKFGGAAVKKKNDVSGNATTPKWLLAVVPPSDAVHKAVESSPPKLKLRLVWSHGCQVERSSIVYNALGEAVYPSGKLCVIYSPRSHTQRFYRGHHAGGPVSAIGAAPNGLFLASGDVAKRPRIHVWDGRAGSTAVILKSFHRRSVSSLSFSADSRRLVSVGADSDGSLAVWRSLSGEWYDGLLQAAVHSCDRTVRFACFGVSNTSSIDKFEICSGGDGHVYFWTLCGRELVSSEALWTEQQHHHRHKSVLCGAAVNDRFVTGLSDGQLLVWKGRVCEKSIKAHDDAIESMHAASGEAGFATGSRDGVVKLWSSRFRHIKSFEITEAPVPPLEPRIRSVHLGLAAAANSLSSDSSTKKIVRILVACASSEVYEIAKESGSITLFPGEGHYLNDLWALCVHPSDPDVFATAGDDMTVRVWSVSAKRLLRKAKLDGPLRSIAWSPDGTKLLLGMGGTKSGTRHPKDGVFLLLDATTLRVTHEARDSRYWFRVASFSPDGTKFAFGSTDHKIYLYDTHSTNLIQKSASHNAYITHIDFSTDSKFIQSDAADFEHLYHETSDGSQIRLPSQLKDIQWHTWSCICGWPVQGCWPSLSGEKHRDPRIKITAVSRNPRQSLLAAGDDAGEVRLFRYPSLQNQLSVKCSHSHASELASLDFTCDGSHLISIGKHDRTIAIWQVEEEEEEEEGKYNKKNKTHCTFTFLVVARLMSLAVLAPLLLFAELFTLARSELSSSLGFTHCTQGSKYIL